MKRLAPFLGAYAAYVIFLHAVDGPWHRWPRNSLFDPWTLTHVAWGAIARRYGFSGREVVALASLNEAVELWTHRNRPDLAFGLPETAGNRIADVATTWAGWALAGG